MTQKIINAFKSKYLDIAYRTDWNSIHLSKADGYEHNRMVFEICHWLIKNDIKFLTQARFKSGLRPDIVVPFGLPKKIIEVRNTETEDKSMSKLKYTPEELHKEILYIDANQEFEERLLW